MEIAIKMALRLNQARHEVKFDNEKLVVLAQNDCYHGDDADDDGDLDGDDGYDNEGCDAGDGAGDDDDDVHDG
jgi:hypothetical protein